MSPKFKELFKQASELSERERATLAGLLIESLEREWDVGAEESWAQEIQRRVEELDSGAVETIPWKKVRARLLEQMKES